MSAVLLAAALAAQAPAVLTRVAEFPCEPCGSVFDLEVAATGGILVVSDETPMLRFFDRGGKPLRQYGRQGSGPGEFLLPARAALGSGGSFQVLDLRARRITRFDADGRSSAVTLSGFPTAFGSRDETGELLVVLDDFRGFLTLERWPLDAAAPVPLSKVANPPRSGGGVALPAVAVSATGIVALVRDPEQYRIQRLGADGTPLPDLTRDVPRVRRTPEEEAELRRRIQQGPGMARAERGASKVPAPLLGSGGPDLSLKPHFAGDPLRFDAGGRLWVLTMRGTPGESVFDLFAPDGHFLGSVTLPRAVRVFGMGGGYLATSSENEDGTFRIELWAVGG